jgi:hypothetical protein
LIVENFVVYSSRKILSDFVTSPSQSVPNGLSYDPSIEYGATRCVN